MAETCKGGQNATAEGNHVCPNATITQGMWIARPDSACELASRAPQEPARSFEKKTMYFALMILIALAVAALVLFLEHRGGIHLLEREDHSRPKISDKTPLK